MILSLPSHQVGEDENDTGEKQQRRPPGKHKFLKARVDQLKAEGKDPARILVALANLLANVVPLYVMCDPNDFAVVSHLRSRYEESPTIFIYDKYPGGINLARRIFSIDQRLFKAAYEIVNTCQCAIGCPSCVGPPEEVTGDAKDFCRSFLKTVIQ